MKKRAILVLIFVLIISFVSAAHECSNGTIKESKKEIKLNGIKNVNGLAIGLIKSDSSILGRYSAEVIADAVEFTLKNSTNFTDNVDLIDDEKTIKLLNLTSEIAGIKVDTHSEEIDLDDGETKTIGSSKVFLKSTEGDYPETALVEGIIGSDLVALDNENPSKIITLDSIEYVIELFSASDSDAIITVKKCEDSDAEIIEIADPVIEETVNESTNDSVDNSATLNNTNESALLNETPAKNNSENNDVILNESSGENLDEGTNLEGQTEKGFLDSRNTLWLVVISTIALIIVIVALLIYIMKKDKKKVPANKVAKK